MTCWAVVEREVVVDGQRAMMVEQAVAAVMTELETVRQALERARQRVLDFDQALGPDAADEMRIAVDVDLRLVGKFLGSEE